MKILKVLSIVLLALTLIVLPAWAYDLNGLTNESGGEGAAVQSDSMPMSAMTPWVLTSFSTDAYGGMADWYSWGIGYSETSDSVWITGAVSDTIRESSPEGVPTGRRWTGIAPGSPDPWWADQEYDKGRGLMYTVLVGGDNGIYTWYPATKAAGPTITDPDGIWTATSQRGVAYDPATDTLYVGGWNSNKIYRIRGLSWPNTGKIIQSWDFPGVAGLAWLSDGTMAVVPNTTPDYIYVVDPASMAVLNTFSFPDGVGYAGAGIDGEKAGPVWLLNQKNQTAYRVDLLRPYSKVTLLEPHRGDVVPSGSIYDIRWGAPDSAVKFKLKYSLDGGATWKVIAKDVAGRSYCWTAPVPIGNKTSCLVKVVGFNASWGVVGSSTSKPFTVEVVKLTNPNGGEVYEVSSGGTLTQTITWNTNATKRTVAKVKLFYTKNGGLTWAPIWTYTGWNPGSHDWDVPYVSTAKTKCKVKVVLKDAAGVTLASDVSDGWFTIKPAPIK